MMKKSKKHDFKLEVSKDQREVRFMKMGYQSSDPGVPLIGWVSNLHIGCWLNHLRQDVNNYCEVEERQELNADHITLYDIRKNKHLGWIEKGYEKEVEDALWKYLKTRAGVNIDAAMFDSEAEDLEPGPVVKKVEQLSLF